MRAASADRETAALLGLSPDRLMTLTFALGCGLAALAGALQMPREPANLHLDLQVVGDAFVIVVSGGLGSVSGAFWAALLVAACQTICVVAGDVQLFDQSFALLRLTIVVEFVLMAAVLLVAPNGLLGKAVPMIESAVNPVAISRLHC